MILIAANPAVVHHPLCVSSAASKLSAGTSPKHRHGLAWLEVSLRCWGGVVMVPTTPRPRRLLALVAGAASLASAGNLTSAKRGLCFVTNQNNPSDYQTWVQRGSDLTWYYDYAVSPVSAYSSLSQDEFEFVPMMWGVGANANDTTFLSAVEAMMHAGRDVQHVLGFNEPNEPQSVGGSHVQPSDAAQAWVANMEPLADKGVKLGLPACSSAPSSFPWLQQFLANCSDLLSPAVGPRKNCTWDFLPLHFYGDFEGLASYIGQNVAAYILCPLFFFFHPSPPGSFFPSPFSAGVVLALTGGRAGLSWPNKTIWITEVAIPDQDLQSTEAFFNETVDYLDRLDYIERYAYFGAFRSKASNVGKDATFLNNAGRLTDIGAWYLGFNETGVNPTSAASSLRPATGLRALTLAGLVAVLLHLGRF